MTKNQYYLSPMKNAVIYLYPMIFDATLSLTLFVNRHSFAEKGLGLGYVGAIPFIYGAIYIVTSLLMGKIVRPHLAKQQMLISIAAMIALLCILANLESVFLILALFCTIPITTSLFFNAFQSFALGIDTHINRPLSHTVGHYTFSWSVGYAFGTLASAHIKSLFSWQAAYYFAAFLVMLLGISALFFKPQKGSHLSPESVNQPTPASQKPLPFSGWLGVFISLIAWIAITTLWPVMAEDQKLPVEIKGIVEFAKAIIQGIAALIICRWQTWYFKPLTLLAFGLVGISGVLIFAIGNNPFIYLAGASLIGIYMGSCFIYMVYHAMYDPKTAVKRVAVNEITVGIGFILGAIVAPALMGLINSYRLVLIILAGFVGIGIIAQYMVTHRTISRAKSN